ncbi:hypothetical protein [Streptomyces sp. NPDC048349]|uniref:hypothetical protein n=1 Tax=Streptomyces sp. NPDC048349 TaxID=3155486 RepID=UPI00344AEBB7
MGMTVLYIAFGFVALWLLAEVLMQYKARLRWRLLAFTGFLGVVAGVVLPSVPVIGAGAAAFAVGQTLVTLSFRKGFEAGWALRRGGEPVRQSGRRRSGGPRPEPALRVTALEYEGADGSVDGAADGHEVRASARQFQAAADEVYSPQPMPDDTGSYGIQSFAPDAGQTAAFAPQFGTGEQDAHQYAAYYDPTGQGGGTGYDYSGGYQTGEQQQVYAAYSDPYIGTGGGIGQPGAYDYANDANYAGYSAYPQYPDYGQQQYSTDTPPGGVWVPQQRSTDGGAQPYPADEQAQQPQQYPYPQQGEYEQYRY